MSFALSCTRGGQTVRYFQQTFLQAMHWIGTSGLWRLCSPSSVHHGVLPASKSRGGFCDHHSSRISTSQRTDSMMESHNPIFGSNGLDLAVFIGHYRFDCLEPLV